MTQSFFNFRNGSSTLRFGKIIFLFFTLIGRFEISSCSGLNLPIVKVLIIPSLHLCVKNVLTCVHSWCYLHDDPLMNKKYSLQFGHFT